ncbi:MAG: hypothetical protein WAT37_21795 [Saprospiraceae bacterium]
MLDYGSYQRDKPIDFIVHKPVQDEFFPVDFRYRVVHHFIISKQNPLFEKEFIQDGYACGAGNGTHSSFITP